MPYGMRDTKRTNGHKNKGTTDFADFSEPLIYRIDANDGQPARLFFSKHELP